MSSSNGEFENLITYAKLVKTITADAHEDDLIAMGLPTSLKAHLLTINAVDASDNALPLFVYQREVFDSRADEDNQYRAFFSHVCSPNDWQELPVGVPEDVDILLFRFESINVVCQTMEEVDFIVREIESDVKALIDHHKKLLSAVINVNKFTTETTIS